MYLFFLVGCLNPCNGTCTDPHKKCAHPKCCNFYISCNTTLKVHKCRAKMLFINGICKGGNPTQHCGGRIRCTEAKASMCTTTTQPFSRTSSGPSHRPGISTRVPTSTTGEHTSTPDGHEDHIRTTELEGTFHVTTRIPPYTDKHRTTTDIDNNSSESTGDTGSSGPTSYASSPTHQHTSSPSTIN